MPQFPAGAFRRQDESPDEQFYRTPRLVTHIDDRAISAVTQLYRKYFPEGGAILDLMSSWISHLPPEVQYERVVGLGMNETELQQNPRLDEYVVQNLNRNPKLPFENGEFDGVGCCVSIDYLTRPIEVLRETGRVLRTGSPVVISFSNRCFPDKAVAVWHQLDDAGHMQLVEHYLCEAGNFENIRALDRSPRRMFSDPLYAVVGESMGPAQARMITALSTGLSTLWQLGHWGSHIEGTVFFPTVAEKCSLGVLSVCKVMMCWDAAYLIVE